MKFSWKYSLLLAVAVIGGCTSHSDDSTRKKAEDFSHTAAGHIAHRDFFDAEQTLLKSIELYSSIDDRPKLVENYSTLASVQVSAGKLASALSSYSTLRNFYTQSGDRNAEIPMMLEMARIDRRLGNPEKTQSLLEEALQNSQLYQLTHIHALTELRLGDFHQSQGDAAQANAYYNQAARDLLLMRDTTNFILASVGKIVTLLSLGKDIEAKLLYFGVEDLMFRNLAAGFIPSSFQSLARAFADEGAWSFAKDLYRNALLTAQQKNNDPHSDELVTPLLGLGEVYFHNFDYPDAVQQYIAAYDESRKHSNSLLEAYSLVRVADCQVKQFATERTQEALIRSLQFYERAQTIFSRLHFGFGEAAVLHKIGMQKELAGDDNAAITYYKQAIATYDETGIDPSGLGLPVDFKDLIATPVQPYSMEEWLTKDLIALLLKYRRDGEAYTYQLTRDSHTIQSKIAYQSIGFQEKNKQVAFTSVAEIRRKREQILHEAFYAAQVQNKSYSEELRRQLDALKQQNEKISSTIDREFPELSVAVDQHHSLDDILHSIPAASAIIHYFFRDNECWAFILRNGENPVALRVSSYGEELRRKMERYLSGFQGHRVSDEYMLSKDLYRILIRPIEHYGQQRFVFIPIPGLEKFPFHSLVRDGRPLINLIEVSYLPSIQLVPSRKPFPRFINNVIAVGFTPNVRWGLEFELRDIRTFFRNAKAFTGQSATLDNVTNTLGEVFQLSTWYQTTPGSTMSFVLSDGTPSTVGTSIPVSAFTSLFPFPLVYLEDVETKTNGIRLTHPLYWMMNGSSAVMTTEFTTNPKMSNSFREHFYSSLSSSLHPYIAYRSAVQYLIAQPDDTDLTNWPAFFYYGM